MTKKGWTKERERHRLARLGIKTSTQHFSDDGQYQPEIFCKDCTEYMIRDGCFQGEGCAEAPNGKCKIYKKRQIPQEIHIPKSSEKRYFNHRFTIIVDFGKPSEIEVKGIQNLQNKLHELYEHYSKQSDEFAYVDVIVKDENLMLDLDDSTIRRLSGMPKEEW
jgi:hypothetical protein